MKGGRRFATASGNSSCCLLNRCEPALTGPVMKHRIGLHPSLRETKEELGQQTPADELQTSSIGLTSYFTSSDKESAQSISGLKPADIHTDNINVSTISMRSFKTPLCLYGRKLFQLHQKPTNPHLFNGGVKIQILDQCISKCDLNVNLSQSWCMQKKEQWKSTEIQSWADNNNSEVLLT